MTTHPDNKTGLQLQFAEGGGYEYVNLTMFDQDGVVLPGTMKFLVGDIQEARLGENGFVKTKTGEHFIGVAEAVHYKDEPRTSTDFEVAAAIHSLNKGQEPILPVGREPVAPKLSLRTDRKLSLPVLSNLTSASLELPMPETSHFPVGFPIPYQAEDRSHRVGQPIEVSYIDVNQANHFSRKTTALMNRLEEVCLDDESLSGKIAVVCRDKSQFSDLAAKFPSLTFIELPGDSLRNAMDSMTPPPFPTLPTDLAEQIEEEAARWAEEPDEIFGPDAVDYSNLVAELPPERPLVADHEFWEALQHAAYAPGYDIPTSVKVTMSMLTIVAHKIDRLIQTRQRGPEGWTTLEDYLKAGHDKGIIDYQIRSTRASSGDITFYIHPDKRDGITQDYYVQGNRLCHDPRVTLLPPDIATAKAAVERQEQREASSDATGKPTAADHYAEVEKEHLGDPDKKTGIYAEYDEKGQRIFPPHRISHDLRDAGKVGVRYVPPAEDQVPPDEFIKEMHPDLPPKQEPEHSVPDGFAAKVTDTVRNRGSDYGTPAENHQLTADVWSLWASRRLGLAIQFSAEDVCMLNVLQKCTRLACRSKDDSWQDVAGYTENVAMLRPDQRNG